MGTADSVDFHYSLYWNDDNIGIFATEVVKTFVHFKSKQNIWFFYLYALPYVAYMITITLATVWNMPYLRGPAVLGTFIVIQLLQVLLYLKVKPLAIR
jgi:hypothetical protein